MKFLNPKWWLIVVGGLNILGGLMNFFMGGDTATTALEAQYGALSTRELEIATGYEEGWGIFSIPYGILAIASGLVLNSDGRAKMAMVAGLSFIATFITLLLVSNSNGYEVPMAQFIPLFVVLLGLTASGYLHMNGDASGGEGV